jgi:uncharacterized membrane protein
MILPWHLYLMAFLYISAGINHFRSPGMYIRIIPPVFKNPKLINTLGGIAEILLGLLLMFPFSKKFAAWGIIALLVAIFPANLFMFQNKKASFGLPRWVLFVRLPLQIVLIYWAYQYTF